MTFNFCCDFPADPSRIGRWLMKICSEDWGNEEPDPCLVPSNCEKFMAWCREKEMNAYDACMLAYKKGPTVGFRYQDWEKYASQHVKTGIVPEREFTKLTPSSKCPCRDETLSISSHISTDTAASSVVSEGSSSEYKIVGTAKRPCRRNSVNSLDEMDISSVPEAATCQGLQAPPGAKKVANKLTEENSPERTTENDVIKTSKPKPIMAYGVQREELMGFSRAIEKEGEVNFTLKMAGEFVRIFPDTFWDKYEIEKILEKLKVDFYIVSDDPKSFKVVIGRLIADTADIEENLKNKGYSVIKVVRMTSRRDSKPLPLYIVHLAKREDYLKIFKLRDIMRIRINVERLRPPKKATQCYRCNLFHHVAKNCRFRPKCGICSEAHESRNCPAKLLPKEQRPTPKCSNCDEEHVSSYKGCKKYPERPSYAQTLKNSTSKQNKKPAVKAPPPTSQRTAKTETIKPKPIYEPQELGTDASSLIELIQNLKQELNISSFGELFETLKEAFVKVSSHKDLIQKRLQFIDCLTKNFSPSSSSDNQPK